MKLFPQHLVLSLGHRFSRPAPISKTCGRLAALLLLLHLLGPARAHAQTGTVAVAANGLTLAYESLGDPRRETVLLISGTGGQFTQWPDALCQALVQRGYRVLRYDQRDSGLSTRLDAAGLPDWTKVMTDLRAGRPIPLAYTLDDMTRDAVGLLDALHIQKVHVVGASMGGMIAQCWPRTTRPACCR